MQVVGRYQGKKVVFGLWFLVLEVKGKGQTRVDRGSFLLKGRGDWVCFGVGLR